MKKALVLFTNYFPFHRGEEYLETELPIARQYFDRILIIPTMVNSTMSRTREVPEGVEVFRADNDCSVPGKVKMIGGYAGRVLGSQKLRKKKKKQCGLSPLKRSYYLYYQSRVAAVTAKVRQYDFSELRTYDDITIYSYWMHAVASIALNIRRTEFRQQKVRLICRGHRYDLYEDKNAFDYIPDRERILKGYTYVFPCSEDGRNHIISRHPGYEKKLIVKRLGTVDKGVAETSNAEPALLISCSSISKVKRLELIVDMLAALKQRGHRFKWLHFGAGADMERIKQYAAEKLDAADYEFKGHVPNETLLQTYRDSKPCLFLNTSSSEGVPVSIMEAMSFGIPVVATKVGGTAELVKDGVSGYLLKENFRPETFVGHVERILKMDADSYQKLCRMTRDRWKEISDAEVVYHDFYSWS